MLGLSEPERLDLRLVNGMRKKWGLPPYTVSEWIAHIRKEVKPNENSAP